MTRLEYIRQFPFSAGEDEDDPPCAAAFDLDNHCMSDNCRDCYKGEATINGNPAPYLFFCPVKPGQTVYAILLGCLVSSADVLAVTFVGEDNGGFKVTLDTVIGDVFVMEDEIDSLIFPTLEAAEKKLEEMKEETKS